MYRIVRQDGSVAGGPMQYLSRGLAEKGLHTLGKVLAGVFAVLYVIFVFIGVVVSLGAVLDFGDMMLLSMAFPNLLGCYILSGKVKAALEDYLERLRTGKMLTYEQELS